MRKPLSKILERLARLTGREWSTGLDSTVQSMLKTAVNVGYHQLCQTYQWPTLRKRGAITLQASYSTGSIDATQGSATITGNSTSWSTIWEDCYLVSGNFLYIISAVGSTTSLTTSPVYVESDVSAGSYYVVKSIYHLPHDFGFMLTDSVRLAARSSLLEFVDAAQMHDESIGRGITVGVPTHYGFAPVRETDKHSCAVTISSNTVTGTAFTSAMDGLPCRLDGEERQYTFNYTNATTGTLTPTYVNPTLGTSTNAVSTTMRIAPANALRIELYPHPELATGDTPVLEFYYQRVPPPLYYVAGTIDSEPALPEAMHDVVELWGYWAWQRDYAVTDPKAVRSAESAAKEATARAMSHAGLSRDYPGGIKPVI